MYIKFCRKLNVPICERDMENLEDMYKSYKLSVKEVVEQISKKRRRFEKEIAPINKKLKSLLVYKREWEVIQALKQIINRGNGKNEKYFVPYYPHYHYSSDEPITIMSLFNLTIDKADPLFTIMNEISALFSIKSTKLEVNLSGTMWGNDTTLSEVDAVVNKEGWKINPCDNILNTDNKEWVTFWTGREEIFTCDYCEYPNEKEHRIKCRVIVTMYYIILK